MDQIGYVDQIIGSEVVLFDIVIYFSVSIGWYGILDHYAKKKLGGSATPGYQALRIPKFISLLVVSAVSVLVGAFTMLGGSMRETTSSFLGIPYLSMWVFYLVVVLRRIRAERNT